MTWLLTLYVFLLLSALLINVPLILCIAVAGDRLRRRSTRLLAAAGLAVAVAYVMRHDWLAGGLVVNAALMAVLLFTRRRLAPQHAGLMLAAGFFAASIYVIWRIEWFDVWRHGMPSALYVLETMGPYPTAVAGAGWILGVRIGPRRRSSEDTSGSHSRSPAPI